MPYTKYSLTPANNNLPPPDGAPEGMLPSAVNDTMRDMMAMIKDAGDGIRNGTYTLTSAVITGGSINGTTVGATTASTGAFTTLTTSSTVTLNGGTANGVAFLNASKVLTTGSALTFDGTTLGLNVGAGNVRVGAAGDTSTHYFRATDTGNASFYLGIDNAAGSFFNAGAYGRSIYSEGNYPIQFVVNSSEQMRLTSTGLGIGTSSPSSRLEVHEANRLNSSNTANVGIYTTTAQSTDVGGTLAFGGLFNGSDLAPFGSIRGGKENSINNNYNGYLAFQTILNSNILTERMRIDSSGNVGIGTSSPLAKLNVSRTDTTLIGLFSGTTKGARIGTSATYSFIEGVDTTGSASYQPFMIGGSEIRFTTSDIERMRIDSSGKLFMGATSFTAYMNGVAMYSDSNGAVLNLGHTATSGNGSGFILFGYNNGDVGSVSQNGTTGVNYNTTSDYRLKNVIAPVSDSGTRLDLLQPIEYDWNTGGRTRGFLAHQFAEVYPSSVTGEKDAVDKDGKPVFQAMQASSTEVMADLIAEIQSLRKRVAQLESN